MVLFIKDPSILATSMIPLLIPLMIKSLFRKHHKMSKLYSLRLKSLMFPLPKLSLEAMMKQDKIQASMYKEEHNPLIPLPIISNQRKK